MKKLWSWATCSKARFNVLTTSDCSYPTSFHKLSLSTRNTSYILKLHFFSHGLFLQDFDILLKVLSSENVLYLVHWFGLKYANLVFLSVFKKYKQDLILRYHDLKQSWEVWKGNEQMSTSLGLKYTNFVSLTIQICMRLKKTLNGLSWRIKEGSSSIKSWGWKKGNFKKGEEDSTGRTFILIKKKNKVQRRNKPKAKPNPSNAWKLAM